MRPPSPAKKIMTLLILALDEVRLPLGQRLSFEQGRKGRARTLAACIQMHCMFEIHYLESSFKSKTYADILLSLFVA